MSLGQFFLSRSERETKARIAIALASVIAVSGYYLIYGSNRWLLFACGAVVAVALFLLRMRVRLIYGALEVLFALFVLWNATGKGRGAYSSDFSSDFATFQLSVVLGQMFGAIYVMIRGLDNVFQGLSEEKRRGLEARARMEVVGRSIYILRHANVSCLVF